MIRLRRKLTYAGKRDILKKMVIIGNCSVGLRIYCADRKKTWWLQAKIPLPKAIFVDFCA